MNIFQLIRNIEMVYSITQITFNIDLSDCIEQGNYHGRQHAMNKLIFISRMWLCRHIIILNYMQDIIV